MKKILLFNLALLMLSLSNLVQAGQGWYVTLTNENTNLMAFYTGATGQNCWYPKSFSNSFTIANPPSSQRYYTEEKWAIFSGCGGSGQNINLSFLVVSTAIPVTTGKFQVALSDTGQVVPASGNTIPCLASDGKGEPTNMTWQWTDGAQHPAPSTPILSCYMQNATVYATITMPAP